MSRALRKALPAIVLLLNLTSARAAAQATDAGDAGEAAGRIHALLTADDWEAALEQAREASAERPDSHLVGSALAEALFRAGLLDEAEPLLERLVADGEATPRARVVLGRLRGAQGRSAEAAELAGQAVSEAPDDRVVLFWAAELTGDRKASADLLKRYVELAAGDDPDRIESARGTLRMLETLGEQEVWVPIQRPERVEVPLLEIRAGGGRVVGYAVKIRLGPKRKAVPVLLDTGSSGLFLVERSALKRGFEPLSEETVFGGGGDQRHRSRRGLFGELSLGDLRFANALATTTEYDLEPRGRFQGVLGISIFAGYRVILDLDRSRLILEQGELLTGGAEFWTLSGQMLVRATVNEDQDALFLFDTGAATTLLSARLAGGLEGVSFAAPAEVRGFGGQREGARFANGVEVRFQERTSASGSLPTIDLSLRNRLAGVEVGGYLGLDLLGRSTIAIDLRTMRLTVSARR